MIITKFLKSAKRIVLELLRFVNHEVKVDSEDANDVINEHDNLNSVEEIVHNVNDNGGRKGISVSVEVPADVIGPVIVACPAGDGGVQGLNWLTRRLKIDEDGDVAHEFLEEVFIETTSSTRDFHHPTFSKFQVNLSNKPYLSHEGTIKRFVDFRGRPQLV
ncbi:hypothetical protein OSB04_029597 [Centaurea solstitialis]|uniref:Uncharacterized protein n=1 Tax=Centaurea solstitialis TaxID=347529 RepID=A0AA38S580_9ASTR|nr:hypothetical protein OSB04_029597 [Centaurea solstitialis]